MGFVLRTDMRGMIYTSHIDCNSRDVAVYLAATAIRPFCDGLRQDFQAGGQAIHLTVDCDGAYGLTTTPVGAAGGRITAAIEKKGAPAFRAPISHGETRTPVAGFVHEGAT